MGSARLGSAATPLFHYKQFLVGWGGSYGNEYRHMYLLTPYLATSYKSPSCHRPAHTDTHSSYSTGTSAPDNSRSYPAPPLQVTAEDVVIHTQGSARLGSAATPSPSVTE